MDFFNYEAGDFIPCEMCGSQAVDVHHLTKQSKFGKKKDKDFIENLCGLCRDCHIKADSDGMFNMFARIRHLENVCHQIYGLIELNKKLDESRKDIYK
jgi:hypothetical protein|tara:strand:- start:296 stop:589 length:294 start_codon:yes stop_codon:yes gene_type:complete